VTVELYSFDDAMVPTESGLVDSAAHALDTAAQSLAMFADLFGEYPYDRFIVVQGDFPDGMELSALVFVGGDWFRSYTGNPAGYLTIITAHEVAHQWWYAHVGSDQANTPWLDEALATYSEFIYFEEYYPELKDWWWQFRVESFVPPDFAGATVDSTVYQFSSIREYINAVYLRGARMLDVRRTGDDAFFDWLRRAEAGTGRVVTADLFWALLSPSELARSRTRRLARRDINAGDGSPKISTCNSPSRCCHQSSRLPLLVLHVFVRYCRSTHFHHSRQFSPFSCTYSIFRFYGEWAI
jgi:hypothetical protein